LKGEFHGTLGTLSRSATEDSCKNQSQTVSEAFTQKIVLFAHDVTFDHIIVVAQHLHH